MALCEQIAPACAALTLLAGCADHVAKAKQQFADKRSCPIDRVEAKERTDLDPVEVANPGPPSQPSAEIAADPGRLAVWQKKQDQLRGYSRGHKVIEVRGCNAQMIYTCTTARSGGPDWNRSMCFPGAYPPGVAAW